MTNDRDLIERLREYRHASALAPIAEILCAQAADRIEALLAEVEKLRAVADAAGKLAHGWLVDEHDDETLCMSREHYAVICALFHALSNASEGGAS